MFHGHYNYQQYNGSNPLPYPNQFSPAAVSFSTVTHVDNPPSYGATVVNNIQNAYIMPHYAFPPPCSSFLQHPMGDLQHYRPVFHQLLPFHSQSTNEGNNRTQDEQTLSIDQTLLHSLEILHKKIKPSAQNLSFDDWAVLQAQLSQLQHTQESISKVLSKNRPLVNFENELTLIWDAFNRLYKNRMELINQNEDFDLRESRALRELTCKLSLLMAVYEDGMQFPKRALTEIIYALGFCLSRNPAMKNDPLVDISYVPKFVTMLTSSLERQSNPYNGLISLLLALKVLAIANPNKTNKYQLTDLTQKIIENISSFVDTNKTISDLVDVLGVLAQKRILSEGQFELQSLLSIFTPPSECTYTAFLQCTDLIYGLGLLSDRSALTESLIKRNDLDKLIAYLSRYHGFLSARAQVNPSWKIIYGMGLLIKHRKLEDVRNVPLDLLWTYDCLANAAADGEKTLSRLNWPLSSALWGYGMLASNGNLNRQPQLLEGMSFAFASQLLPRALAKSGVEAEGLSLLIGGIGLMVDNWHLKIDCGDLRRLVFAISLRSLKGVFTNPLCNQYVLTLIIGMALLLKHNQLKADNEAMLDRFISKYLTIPLICTYSADDKKTLMEHVKELQKVGQISEKLASKLEPMFLENTTRSDDIQNDGAFNQLADGTDSDDDHIDAIIDDNDYEANHDDIQNARPLSAAATPFFFRATQNPGEEKRSVLQQTQSLS